MKKVVNGIEIEMTSAEIAAKQAEEQAWLKEQSKKNQTIKEQPPYIEQRRNAYPEIGDQLDMLWHTIDKDILLQKRYFDFYQTIKKVKVKYPKT
jgi:hypothetical protein